jgi:hypothetical protein
VPLGGIEFMVISMPFNAKLTERVDQVNLKGLPEIRVISFFSGLSRK